MEARRNRPIGSSFCGRIDINSGNTWKYLEVLGSTWKYFGYNKKYFLKNSRNHDAK